MFADNPATMMPRRSRTIRGREVWEVTPKRRGRIIFDKVVRIPDAIYRQRMARNEITASKITVGGERWRRWVKQVLTGQKRGFTVKNNGDIVKRTFRQPDGINVKHSSQPRRTPIGDLITYTLEWIKVTPDSVPLLTSGVLDLLDIEREKAVDRLGANAVQMDVKLFFEDDTSDAVNSEYLNEHLWPIRSQDLLNMFTIVSQMTFETDDYHLYLSKITIAFIKN